MLEDVLPPAFVEHGLSDCSCASDMAASCSSSSSSEPELLWGWGIGRYDGKRRLEGPL